MYQRDSVGRKVVILLDVLYLSDCSLSVTYHFSDGSSGALQTQPYFKLGTTETSLVHFPTLEPCLGRSCLEGLNLRLVHLHILPAIHRQASLLQEAILDCLSLYWCLPTKLPLWNSQSLLHSLWLNCMLHYLIPLCFPCIGLITQVDYGLFEVETRSYTGIFTLMV